MSDLLSERMREHLFRVSENEPVTSPEAGWPDEVAALEAKLEAMERAINGGSRLVLRGDIVGDYDGAYDWIDKSSYNDPDNQVGHHPAGWPGEGYMVVRLVNEDALAIQQEKKDE